LLSTRLSNLRRNPDLLLLVVTVFCLMAGFGVQVAILFNWLNDSLGLRPARLGLLESFRECPGLFMILVAALTARVREPLLAGISLFLVALGLAAYSQVTGFGSLVAFSLLWSAGLHTWMPVSASIALSLSERRSHGKRLGQVGSAGSLGMLSGMGLVLILGKTLSYPTWWLVAGAMVAVGAVIAPRISAKHCSERPRFVLKRKYGVYYGLTLLEGCRKQVFITFAVYVLVREFHTTLRVIAGLMLVNSLVGFALAPRVGRLVDRFGERKMLMTSYTCLIGVFLGYAFFRSAYALYLMYILDSLLFLASVGNSTYLKKIADPGDVTPSLATGVTMNHIAAVLVPVTGGLMWDRFSYQPVFIGGAVVVMLSILFANRVRVVDEKPGEPAELWVPAQKD